MILSVSCVRRSDSETLELAWAGLFTAHEVKGNDSGYFCDLRVFTQGYFLIITAAGAAIDQSVALVLQLAFN
jgi:hypothetical protein